MLPSAAAPTEVRAILDDIASAHQLRFLAGIRAPRPLISIPHARTSATAPHVCNGSVLAGKGTVLDAKVRPCARSRFHGGSRISMFRRSDPSIESNAMVPLV